MTIQIFYIGHKVAYLKSKGHYTDKITVIFINEKGEFYVAKGRNPLAAYRPGKLKIFRFNAYRDRHWLQFNSEREAYVKFTTHEVASEGRSKRYNDVTISLSNSKELIEHIKSQFLEYILSYIGIDGKQPDLFS